LLEQLISFLENAEFTDDSFMDLKFFILNLAAKGRISSPESGDCDVLPQIEKFKSNKQDLIEKKIIPKSKSFPVIEDEEFPYELPAHWELERLGEVSHLITKGSTPTTYGHEFKTAGVRFVKIENIDRGIIDHDIECQYIDDLAHESQKRSQLQEGDVLFSIAGTIGKTCLVSKADLPANTNQALAIIRGTGEIFVPGFLRLILDSVVSDWMRQRARGMGMPNVSLTDLRLLPVPIPPMEEQLRVLEKTDHLMANMYEMRQNFEELQELRTSLFSAHLHEVLEVVPE